MIDLDKIEGFDWDAGNARKSEKHGITQAEAEQVFLNEPLFITPDEKHSESERRYRALGKRQTVGAWWSFSHWDNQVLWSGSYPPVIWTQKKGSYMSKKLKSIPKFKSEAEERRFWETHNTTEYFDSAKTVRGRFPNLKPSTRSISLRLPLSLLEAIRIEANKRDVPYQSLIKVWLSERLKQRTPRIKSEGYWYFRILEKENEGVRSPHWQVYVAGLLPFPNYWLMLLVQIFIGTVMYVCLCRLFRLTAFMDIWQAGWDKMSFLRAGTTR